MIHGLSLIFQKLILLEIPYPYHRLKYHYFAIQSASDAPDLGLPHDLELDQDPDHYSPMQLDHLSSSSGESLVTIIHVSKGSKIRVGGGKIVKGENH